MHMKRASVAIAMAGISHAVEKRGSDSPAIIEHVYIGSYTSTIFSTSTSTVVACGPDVTNCPTSQTDILTSVVPAFVTVCPYTSVSTETPSGAGSGPVATITSYTTAATAATAAPLSVSLSSSVSETLNTAGAASESTSNEAAPSSSSATGITAGAIGASGSGSTSHTTVKTTVQVTQYSTVFVAGSSSTVAVPASGPGSESANTAAPNSESTSYGFAPTTAAASTVSTASSNAVGSVGATGTGSGSLAPTNGTLSTQSVPPTSTYQPYVGSAQELHGGIAGLLIAAAAFFL